MINIAVYGTLREGQGNNRCLLGSPKLGTFRLKGFSMVSLGGFPAIDYDEGGEITAEVYECNVQAEERCNMLEGYRPDQPVQSFYDRVAVDTPFGEAVIYIMRGILGDSEDDKIPDGDWVRYST